MKFTDRMERVFLVADLERERSNCQTILSVHLLLALLEERTGVLGEIFLRGDFDCNRIRSQINEHLQTDGIYKINERSVSDQVRDIFVQAKSIMENYNQVFINEGHVLKALVTSGETAPFLTEKQMDIILTLGTVSRDMITHLQHYSFPEIPHRAIRKINADDFVNLVRFVEQNFSGGWVDTIKSALVHNEPPIYIAYEENGGICGFSAFDCFQNKKGYFGPMGVVTPERGKGIGYSLLHYCLREMKEIGYEYAVIGGAGPMEFYEKACNAVVIPAPYMR